MNWKLGAVVTVVLVVGMLSGCPVKPDDKSCDAGCFGDEFCDVSTNICVSRGDDAGVDAGRSDAGSPDGGHGDAGIVDAGTDAGTGPCTPSVVCREAQGPCDLPETCNSDRECPPDSFKPASTECRPANVDAGCDVTEYCTGASAECPVDMAAPGNTVCRSPLGLCDAEERCDGVSTACPADLYWSTSTVCHPSQGDCDPVETCTGSSVDCPADLPAPQGTSCRESHGDCDHEEVCDGVSRDCPIDQYLDAGVVCRSPADLCDAQEVCTGTSVTCPADGVLPNGTTCRAAVNTCDAREVCNGVAMTCPADAFQLSTYPCVTQFCVNGVFTPPRYCAGNTPTCNPGGSDVSCNGYQCNGTECGTSCSSSANCLSTHFCDTSSNKCSPLRPNGQGCTNASTGYQCSSGTCIQVWPDNDNDGFGSGTPTYQCGAAAYGWAANNSDCCDTDGNAKPGQTGWFTTARTGCGGYDYDCSGGETKQYTLVNACQTSGTCTASVCIEGTGWTSAASPACGATGTYATACTAKPLTAPSCNGGESCQLTSSTRTQPCH